MSIQNVQICAPKTAETPRPRAEQNGGYARAFGSQVL
jgi:hypothetical protein